MDEKRSNSSLWKIYINDDETPLIAQKNVIENYRSLTKVEGSKYAPLHKIALAQRFDDVIMDLYIRIREGWSVQAFLSGYLANELDKRRFRSRAVDTCLFITIADSLFAVTSGSGHNILLDYADYSFPFDLAKRLFANKFSATEIRSIAGATTSRTETYRRGQSIGSSDSFGKVWKRLVSRLNTKLLPDDSYLLKLIDQSKPPTIEIKSSFVLKKSLDLRQLVLVAKALEVLPEPNDEQRRQLSFLDNLYQVKSRTDKAELNKLFVECIRRRLAGEDMDLDVCDPDDVARYYAGSNFKISYQPTGGAPPDAADVLDALRIICSHTLNDPDAFHGQFNSLKMSYTVDPDDDSDPIAKDLIKFLHGQVDRDGQAYFLLDRFWYRVQGEFLENLKRDFIQEVFDESDPILIGSSDLSFLDWKGIDEATFNLTQAKQAGYHYGDKIFATSNMGKVELFDLIKVDLTNHTLYVIHVKDGFDAKMRDACSQIQMSADVISQDVKDRKEVLKEYYVEWRTNEVNRLSQVDERTFLGWFDLDIVYVVLVSTSKEFTASTFRLDLLRSHIARREILVTFHEFRAKDNVFRLAHTPRS